VFSLRLKIEPAGAAQGAKLASEVDHAAASAALDRLNDAFARGDFSSSGQLNRAFYAQTYQSFVKAVSAGTRSIALSHSGLPEKRLRMKSMNNLTFIVPRWVDG
jgi:DNA-binding GntR family transcriptional regulator